MIQRNCLLLCINVCLLNFEVIAISILIHLFWLPLKTLQISPEVRTVSYHFFSLESDMLRNVEIGHKTRMYH